MLVVATIIPSFIVADDRQRDLVYCKSNIKDLAMAMEMYATDYDSHYPANLGQLTPNYLREIPQCRRYFQTSYHLQIGLNNLGNVQEADHYFLISCVGSNHLGVLPVKDYPKINSDFVLMETPGDMPTGAAKKSSVE